MRHVRWAVCPCGASERLQRAQVVKSERFVIRRKERGTISGGQLAFSIARIVRSPARAVSVSGSVIGSSGPVHTRARLHPRWVGKLRAL